jgi:hypothetical protein
MNFDDFNLTELVAIAREVEPEAHRGLGREALIAVIEGKAPPLPQRSINKRRLQITQYVDTYWEQVSSLVSCPAKSRDPWACFGCSDIQAAACIIENKEKIEDLE